MTIYASGDLITNRYEVIQGPREKPSLEGGLGVVYICLDHQTGLPVALKTFKPEYLPDRAARDRFLREGTTWMHLGAHPHIVRCYEVIRDANGLEVYLALELIAKEQGREDASLRSWLPLRYDSEQTPGHPLPPETALLFALQIARGMQHAVACIPGFVHRDLKPENVLVGADHLPGTFVNHLRMTDFGLASVLQDVGNKVQDPKARKQEPAAMRHTQLTHGIAGTPLYMAPEQWMGNPVGVYTDVYALGCILYEMLTGYTAAAGDNPDDWARAHCTGDLRPLPETIPAPVRYLLARCLALAPANRYLEWDNVEFVLKNAYTAMTGESAPPLADATTLNHEEQVAAGWSYCVIGSGYLDLGKAKVAIGYFERALAAGQVTGELHMKSAALNNLGLAYTALGDVQRAIWFYEQCFDIAHKIGDQWGKGPALNNLGLAYAALGDAQRAIGFHEQALAVDREIGDRQGEGNALGSLGLAYFRLGDARQAIRFYEQQLIIIREIGDRRVEVNVLNNLGLAYADLGDAQRAIRFYEHALATSCEIGDRRGEGTVLGNLGNAYLQLGDARQVVGFYKQQLVITREIGDRRGEGNALGSLGSAYLQLGDARQALGFHEQQLVITREIGDRQGEGLALGSLGNAYADLGDAQRALGYYEQHLAITREIGDRREEGNARSNLGSVYADLGDAQRAIGYYEQALAINREVGDINGVARNSFNMARLYAQQGEAAHALPLAQEAARIWVQIGHAQYAQRAQQLVAQLQGGGAVDGESAANITQQAFEAFQRADSMFAMQRAVQQFPFMIEVGFLAMIEQFIEKQLPPEHRPPLEERLVALQQIAAEHK